MLFQLLLWKNKEAENGLQVPMEEYNKEHYMWRDEKEKIFILPLSFSFLPHCNLCRAFLCPFIYMGKQRNRDSGRWLAPNPSCANHWTWTCRITKLMFSLIKYILAMSMNLTEILRRCFLLYQVLPYELQPLLECKVLMLQITFIKN